MGELETGGPELSRIHRKSNDKKWFCYFTGFLEGVEASGRLERGEIEPLMQQCAEFVENVGDSDARDILEDFGADLLEYQSIADATDYRAREIDPSCDRSAKNRFNGFCAGIACDDLITEAEVQKALDLLRAYPELVEDRDVAALQTTLLDAKEDGIITPEESAEICRGISEIVGDSYSDTGFSSLGGVSVFKYAAFEEILPEIENHVFALTGAFALRPRRLIEDALRELGGEVGKKVTQKTTCLIVAMEASRDWIETHQGHKIKDAKRLYEEVGRPLILNELDVTSSLGLQKQ